MDNVPQQFMLEIKSMPKLNAKIKLMGYNLNMGYFTKNGLNITILTPQARQPFPPACEPSP